MYCNITQRISYSSLIIRIWWRHHHLYFLTFYFLSLSCLMWPISLFFMQHFVCIILPLLSTFLSAVPLHGCKCLEDYLFSLLVRSIKTYISFEHFWTFCDSFSVDTWLVSFNQVLFVQSLDLKKCDLWKGHQKSQFAWRLPSWEIL